MEGIYKEDELAYIFTVACHIWGLGEGLVVSLRVETLTGWEATSLPSLLLCLQTLCPSTWMSGGHSSSWPESLTAPSRCLGMNAACTDLALPHGRPSARRGPWHPVYPLQQVVFPVGPGWMPATPEVPAFGLLYLPTPWPSCARLPGARG